MLNRYIPIWTVVALTGLFLIAPNPSAQAQRSGPVAFQPPTDERLPDSAGGATRPASQKCRQDPNSEHSLSALIPSGQVGLTTTDTPAIFVYLPPTQATSVYFSLKNAQDEELYSEIIPIEESDGILQVELPATVAPLELEQTYHWDLGILCNPAQTDLPWVSGVLRRVSPTDEIPSDFAQWSPLEQAAWYGDAGLWYDTLNLLAQEYRQAPENPQVLESWTNLLTTVGLGELAEEAFLTF
ncbi:MAG: DUF928 domain-containing protein [Phormidium sp.]|nr:MAG: protein of Unknown Function containing DUF928 domain [Phormidium sp. OSCR]